MAGRVDTSNCPHRIVEAYVDGFEDISYRCLKCRINMGPELKHYVWYFAQDTGYWVRGRRVERPQAPGDPGDG